MTDEKRAVNGDFHVIRMDGLFHVVFRPDTDPEWFRIIATFFTYDRAYMYCDLERVSVWTYGEDNPESETGEEELKGLRPAPVHLELPKSELDNADGIPAIVRNIYDGGDHVEPHAVEDFSEHPNEDEPPKDFHDRQFQQAIAKTDKPTCAECGKPRHPSSGRLCRACYRVTPTDGDEPLTPNQTKVLKFFRRRANPLNLANATYPQIADGAGIIKASASGIVESLERRGLIEVVERGKPGRESIFRVLASVDRSPEGEKPQALNAKHESAVPSETSADAQDDTA